MINKNKKGISPLIATVLVIGFTIVLAALVITWGTRLFKDTVAQTESTSNFNLACTSGLNMEAKAARTLSGIELTLRNKNQDREISDFTFLAYGADGLPVGEPADGGSLVVTVGGDTLRSLKFPAPKIYTLTSVDGVTKVEVYPKFTIEGETKACDSPITAKVPA